MYETKRLILREWQDLDLAPFIAMGQDPLVMEHFPGLLTPEESSGMIDRINAIFKEKGFCFYACELKSSGEFIGFIGLSTIGFKANFTSCIQIGWRIASQHWGNGYATEGALKCLEIGFNVFNLNEIVSFAVKNNYKSHNVMDKIGMQRDLSEDFLHPNFAPEHSLAPHVLYRMPKSSWLTLK
ncbi:MAG: N-acetyltransferase [Neisseriales bacterium]|nr:MAG: N-acetyltransferase [Neisseriales bacterium]